MNKSQLNKAIDKEIERLESKRSCSVTGTYFAEAEELEGSIPSKTIKFTNSKELAEYLANQPRDKVIILDEAGFVKKGMSACSLLIAPYVKDGRIKFSRSKDG